MDLTELIAIRGRIKASITRFKTFLSKCNPDQTHNLEQLPSRLDKIKESWTLFEDIQQKIERLDEENSEKSQGEREMFEDSYFEVVAQAEKLISNNQANLSEPPMRVKQNQTIEQSQTKLPQIQVPSFSGHYEDWIAFKELFTAVVDQHKSLDDVHKLYYLRQALKGGTAEKMIDSIDLIGQNYQMAWQMLRERFQNERLITERHLKKLFDYPKVVKESSDALRQLLDNTNIQLRALRALNQPVDTWDTILVHFLSSKLDFNSYKEWQRKAPSDRVATLPEFVSFVNKRSQTLEAISCNNQTQSTNQYDSKSNTRVTHSSNKNNKVVYHAAQKGEDSSSLRCMICKDIHKIFACPEFQRMTVQTRRDKTSKLKLCFNCLRQGHVVKECKVASTCKICRHKHNTLLHDTQAQNKDNSEATKLSDSTKNEAKNSIDTVVTCTSQIKTERLNPVLLATALVDVVDASGSVITCRALLDPGSSINIMSEEISQQLKIHRKRLNANISGISNSVTEAKYVVIATIKSRFSGYQSQLDFIILPKVTQPLPTAKFDISTWNIPKKLFLADPQFHQPNKIDLLLGVEIFLDLLCIGQIKLNQGFPSLQKTTLGWIIAGKIPKNNSTMKSFHCHHATSEDIGQQLEKFWAVEENYQGSNHKVFTGEEAICEELFKNTVKRANDGRFVVQLPFKANISKIGRSKETAIKRFLQLERRLTRDESLKSQYTSFMDEYERLNHMEVTEDSPKQQHYFIPHHPVIKTDSTTTKLRVVFDASCKSDTNLSLNDCLMVGPVVQQDLFSIVIRFRKHIYALTGDIEKMYRQISIDPEHISYQLILWRKDPSEILKTYKLKTVTYGTASAPFLATRTLKQLSIENEKTHKVAAESISSDFYVDDVLTGANSIKEARELQQQLIHLLQQAGFHLRKWCANEQKLLEHLAPENRELSYNFNNDETVKTLGIHWNAQTDTFQFVANINNTNPITKRSILSETARLFDPLGLVSPIIVKAKVILQELWRLSLSWDESVPTHIHTKWTQLRDSIQNINQMRIPRCIISASQVTVQLHTFSDASEIAYGACVYLRCDDMQGNIKTSLVCAKARVAPLKKVTLPRLELCGAILAAELAEKTVTSLKLNITEKYFWSDSTIVLSWLSAATTNWSVFVSNRVAKIQNLSDARDWRHVKSQENPADLVSRGVNADQLITSTLWWNGPYWLSETSTWNHPQNLSFHPEESLPEYKQKGQSFVVIERNQLIYEYSSIIKLQRVIAYVFRFCNNCKCRESNLRETKPLTTYELQHAMTQIIKIVQAEHFSEDIQQIKHNKMLSRNSKLLPLNPFLDKDNVLRVGGRLQNSEFSYNQKHPILLPEKNLITRLLINYEHVRLLHAGPSTLIASLRLKYWPINAKKLAKKAVNQCTTCFRVKPKHIGQLMGELPAQRVSPARPFLSIGVDYCGPIEILNAHRRGARTVKGYISIFICMATKAIHLELVQELTTKAFLAAFQRFMARRGKVKQVFSDNATNFVGAKNELRQLHNLFATSEHQNEIIHECNKDEIIWNFIPPRSPHFGGLWEAGVKSVKHHLVRIVGKSRLTYDELYTVLCKIESVLNSRPITPLSSNPSDLNPLTPGHFLIGEPLTAIPERNEIQSNPGRIDRWRRINQLTQNFWNRWRKDFISELQSRVKWRTNSPNVQTGTLALIHEDNVPPLYWRLGRIIETIPGPDGRVRVVVLKTAIKQ